MKYYIELKEKRTDDNDYRPREILRKYVEDAAAAEQFYQDEIVNWVEEETDAIFVEMNHDIDPTKNKSCVATVMIGGKVNGSS